MHRASRAKASAFRVLGVVRGSERRAGPAPGRALCAVGRGRRGRLEDVLPSVPGPDGSLPRRVVTLFAPALHPVLELSLHRVERAVGCLAGIVEETVLGRGMADENLVLGKTELDGDAEALAAASTVTGELDHHVARDNAVEYARELLGAPIDVGRECIRVRDAAERELKGRLHRQVSARLRCTNRAR